MKKFAIAMMVLSLGLFSIVGCGGDEKPKTPKKTDVTKKDGDAVKKDGESKKKEGDAVKKEGEGKEKDGDN
ncbi:hypothetical protein MNBD_PLANCTO02-470 [hydrothermal vent metagenome]|uniref:Lipoprotein n=1 Tax=hydrothermal vent metagenome TaxID=652676 RepID=A0A3B1DWC1_9ZZZZ